MAGVGYVSGNTLEDVQGQWAEFVDVEVDAILFDRTCLNTGFSMANRAESDPEKEAIWRYMETMSAAQDLSGNAANHQDIEDLGPGDVLVLTNLAVLATARPDAWEQIMALVARGGRLAVLSYGFHSGAQHGDMVLKMMNALYLHGRSR